jgi:putative transposase
MPFNRMSDVAFFTATILNWNHALINDERKDIIIDSLRFLVVDKRIKLYGFVIMPNHIHLLWQNIVENSMKWRSNTQGSLLKFTANKLLAKMDFAERKEYFVDAIDRRHQIWERDPLWIECLNMEMAEQKLNYIHNNPCTERWQLATDIASYKYSSCGFYKNGTDEFGLLSNLYG